MYLFALDFWNLFLFVVGVLILAGLYHVAWWLAGISLMLVHFLTFSGLHRVAKFMLAIFVSYDYRTYQQNRMLYWNRVGVRIAIMWGIALVIAFVLGLLRFGNKIHSVSELWLIIIAAYLGVRAILYLIAPPRRTGGAIGSFRPDVNERTNPNGWPTHQIIRRWDFLDKLFATSS